MSTANNSASVDHRLNFLAGLVGAELEHGDDLEEIASLIRRNAHGPLTRRDVEGALEIARRDLDKEDAQSSYIWSTLALAVLQIARSDISGIPGRIRRVLLEGSGHARDLEAFGHMLRGSAAAELGRFETARHQLERAKEAYSGSPDGDRLTARVNIRLARIELLGGNWQKAELIAEGVLHRMGDWGTADDKGECLRVIGAAQFGMGRLEAALDSATRILATANVRVMLRAQAHLQKAIVELELDQLETALSDSQKAATLFDEAGDEHGIRDSIELQSRIDKRRV